MLRRLQPAEGRRSFGLCRTCREHEVPDSYQSAQ
jgi:hypothetical protein